MEVKELRIGNYVKAIQGNFETNKMWIKEKDHIYSNNDCVEITAKGLVDIEDGLIKVEPIPLTKEWLIKFGFYKRLNEAGAYNMFAYRKKIKTTWSSYLYFIIDDENKSISGFDIRDIEAYKYEYKAKQTTYPVNNKTVKYVHQLQNIYFALTGQELTLK